MRASVAILKIKDDSATYPVIGHDLKRCVIDRDRKLRCNFATPVTPGCDQARTDEDGRQPGIFRFVAAKAINVFVLAGTSALHPDEGVLYLRRK